jgi:hypothetical protein
VVGGVVAHISGLRAWSALIVTLIQDVVKECNINIAS